MLWSHWVRVATKPKSSHAQSRLVGAEKAELAVKCVQNLFIEDKNSYATIVDKYTSFSSTSNIFNFFVKSKECHLKLGSV